MKQLACGAVVDGCAAVFKGRDEDEVMQQVAVHAREDHGMEDVPPEVVEQIRANIVEV